ncbi:hypothetical protein O9G_001785 [Rozella allomycis CSF55]|uniref:Uncharacterized protein n=1 Tax=Rozella allomycis (strain CSF55) TaxID=988480 RepID=A0A075B0N3_ROZAC|nr:hypothetical protein O9G_001785 [Rozella allomycis CSF55]|eukprot:EPZ34529.1 hypothetical protein O9G_001785 [Rozella allomycis CSF55]
MTISIPKLAYSLKIIEKINENAKAHQRPKNSKRFYIACPLEICPIMNQIYPEESVIPYNSIFNAFDLFLKFAGTEVALLSMENNDWDSLFNGIIERMNISYPMTKNTKQGDMISDTI